MSADPRISVLLPCYNAAGTLEDSLASLRDQTFTDFEIIAVDDGSCDSTLRMLESFSERDPRLRVIPIEHGGIITALNAGLAACQAEFVARMDADDIALPQRLERQFEYLLDHPKITAAGCLVEGFPDGQVREGFQIYIQWLNSLVNPEQIAREMFVESPLAHPSVMYRRAEILAASGYEEHGWPEDYDLWLRLHLRGSLFGKVPEILLRWREAPERLTRTDSRYSLENFLRLKAHALVQGPLRDCDGTFIWGAGMMGKRISKHLVRAGAKLAAFIDIDPDKIGRLRRSRPVIAPEDLSGWLKQYRHPVVLAAVGARGARTIIRSRLNEMKLVEGKDWWAAA